MWWFLFFNGENKDRNKTNIAFGRDLAPHIEISLAWRPGMLSDISPAAINNDFPPPLCNHDVCIKEEKERKEREDKPHLLSMAGGTLGTWHQSGVGRGALGI